MSENVYRFDRYVRGRKMAEGVKITTATNAFDAADKARKLYATADNQEEMRATKFVLTEINGKPPISEMP